MKGQSNLEYLLVIGGAVAIFSIAVVFILNTISSGQGGVEQNWSAFSRWIGGVAPCKNPVVLSNPTIGNPKIIQQGSPAGSFDIQFHICVPKAFGFNGYTISATQGTNNLCSGSGTGDGNQKFTCNYNGNPVAGNYDVKVTLNSNGGTPIGKTFAGVVKVQ